MRIPLIKLKALLLYFATHTETRYLGKVKLMKLIYFADFLHVKKYGLPITFDKYYHLEHGPIPTVIKNMVDTAADEPEYSKISDVIKVEKPQDYNIFRILPVREFKESDAELFSQAELETLKEVALRFGNTKTDDIKEASHKEAPWSLTEYREEIPYALAAKDKDSIVGEDGINLLSKITT